MSPAQAEQFFMLVGLVGVIIAGCATAGLWYLIHVGLEALDEALNTKEDKHE